MFAYRAACVLCVCVFAVACVHDAHDTHDKWVLGLSHERKYNRVLLLWFIQLHTHTHTSIIQILNATKQRLKDNYIEWLFWFSYCLNVEMYSQ